MRRTGAVAAWTALYVVVAVLPLPLSLVDLDPGRGFWTNFSVALGFVGLSMYGLQFALAARSRVVSEPVGMDALLLFHRQVSYVALALVLAHPVVLLVLDSRFWPLLNVFTSPLRAKLAVASVVAVLVLTALSVWRRRLRLRYETWQALHAVLAVVVVVTALGHALLVGYYVREPWEQALWVALTAVFVALGVWVRIVKPLLRVRRRWVVEEVRPEPGGCTALVLRLADPSSYGRRGFSFRPGQFAWVTVRRSPFALTYHPFSFSSSAERPDRVEFTVKAYGAFTSDLGGLVPGETVYLDGPYGSFTLDAADAADAAPGAGAPLLLVGAGVGVTPLLSMAATLADRGDPRPRTLVLGSRHEGGITGGEQVAALAARGGLAVVHVLSAPSQGWTGERGHVDAAVLRRHLPGDPREVRCFVCGPDAFMDAVEAALREVGVPAAHVASERFAMV